jgi:hypothetical protein
MFILTESSPARRLAGSWVGRSLPLFETSGPQPLRELKGGGDFPIFIPRNPLKRLDSEK